MIVWVLGQIHSAVISIIKDSGFEVIESTSSTHLELLAEIGNHLQKKMVGKALEKHPMKRK
jgi:hypothetical protein